MKHRLATVLTALSASMLLAACATPVERANEKNEKLPFYPPPSDGEQ